MNGKGISLPTNELLVEVGKRALKTVGFSHATQKNNLYNKFVIQTSTTHTIETRQVLIQVICQCAANSDNKLFTKAVIGELEICCAHMHIVLTCTYIFKTTRKSSARVRLLKLQR